jgi:hypothetical protein
MKLLLISLVCLIATGCSTNQKHPGPAVGTAVGFGTGVVAGNVAGGVVGAGAGFTAGVKKPFETNTRTIRVWQTKTTSDGRRIQVPVDMAVDENGDLVQ